jgi:hypothetical protein
LVNEWEKNTDLIETQKEDDHPDYIEELLNPSV